VNLEHLQTLVSIVEQGSLSGAARARRISQPAVTKQVQRMEAEFGLPLMVRGPQREVALTPAGERLLAFARETLASYGTLERDLATLREVQRGVLHLAASTIPGEYVLPRLLAAFQVEYPQIEVRMIISDTADVATRLLAKEADLGVIGSTLDRPGLSLEPLVNDQIVLAVPPDHPFAGRKKVAVAELLGQPLILREEGSGTRRSVEAALATAGLSLPRGHVKLTLGSTQAVLQAVAQGLGVGFVSERAAGQALADVHLTCVELEDVELKRVLYFAYLPERMGDPIVARFLSFVRDQLARA
jgi:DNA-binding transcriptional LysR family regulator